MVFARLAAARVIPHLLFIATLAMSAFIFRQWTQVATCRLFLDQRVDGAARSTATLEHRYAFHTDAEGFRNAVTRDPIGVAALGDSCTDALTMRMEDGWPMRLEGRLGLSVQNYGTAGFGPRQELRVLTDYALRHRPKVVVLAFFAGNDIRDAELFELAGRTEVAFNSPAARLADQGRHHARRHLVSSQRAPGGIGPARRVATGPVRRRTTGRRGTIRRRGAVIRSGHVRRAGERTHITVGIHAAVFEPAHPVGGRPGRTPRLDLDAREPCRDAAGIPSRRRRVRRHVPAVQEPGVSAASGADVSERRARGRAAVLAS